MLNKKKLLQIALTFGVIYYFIGAIAHFFGMSLFPFYDSHLYSPYHDMLIALASFTIALVIGVVAKDPIKNKDTLNIVIVGVILASLFSILVIWKVDFVALGAAAKKTQTLFEGIVGLVYAGILLLLYPRR